MWVGSSLSKIIEFWESVVLRRFSFFLLSFLIGGLWHLHEYYAWMSLSGYRVEAESPVLEERFWKVFPSRGIYFWPFLVIDEGGVQEFLERDIPVFVDTRMTRLGKFVTTIKWLTPWLKVRWHGRLWCISKEGRMWDTLEMGIPFDAGSVEGPVWRLPQLDEGSGPPPSGVFVAPVKTDAVAGFLSEYERYVWFGSVREIVWDRRAGMDLFRLKLVQGQQNFEILLQPEKYPGQELGVTLGKVLSDLYKKGGNHLIDATYEGKILLKDISGGPKEGSMK